MRYYIIAGEASGDLHGSNLIRGLRAEDPQADIRFWGGAMMQEAGGTMVRDYGRAGALLKMQSLGYAHAVDLAETRVLAASPHGYPHLDETFGISAPFPGTAPGGNFYSSIDHTYVRNATGITVKRYETCQEYVTFGISDHSPQLIDVVVP